MFIYSKKNWSNIWWNFKLCKIIHTSICTISAFTQVSVLYWLNAIPDFLRCFLFYIFQCKNSCPYCGPTLPRGYDLNKVESTQSENAFTLFDFLWAIIFLRSSVKISPYPHERSFEQLKIYTSSIWAFEKRFLNIFFYIFLFTTLSKLWWHRHTPTDHNMKKL